MLDIYTCIQLFVIFVLSGLTCLGIAKLASHYTIVPQGKDAPQGQATDLKNILRSYNANLAKSMKKGKKAETINTQTSDIGDMIKTAVKVLPDVLPYVEKIMTPKDQPKKK